jgi:ParB family chromosome partitioning protein
MASNFDIQPYSLDQLRPHPRQADLFGLPTDQDPGVRELADSMRRDGLRDPIDILPDGTILAGHRRVAAARWLGWNEIEVRIRHDLLDSPQEAERFVIEDNLMRRHLDRIALARLYVELKNLAKCGPRASRSAGEDLRELIGQRLGLRGRTLDRMAFVLTRCPPEVLRAVEDRRLTQQIAEKIAGLDHEARERISAAIQRGDDPRRAANEELTVPIRSVESREAERRVSRRIRMLLAEVRRVEHGLQDFARREPGSLRMLVDLVAKLQKCTA